MFCVYILQCSDGAYYIGATSDVEARVIEHNEGRLGACHIFLRRPVTLVYTESLITQLEAMRRERQLENWSHANMTTLIAGGMATLKGLTPPANLYYRNSTMNDLTSQPDIIHCTPEPSGDGLFSLNGDHDQALARLAKALGHPARVAILRLLIARSECICGEICDEIPLAQSTISQHLKMMKEAGLIQGEVDGPRICYCVHRANLQKLKALIAAL